MTIGVVGNKPKCFVKSFGGSNLQTQSCTWDPQVQIKRSSQTESISFPRLDNVGKIGINSFPRFEWQSIRIYLKNEFWRINRTFCISWICRKVLLEGVIEPNISCVGNHTGSLQFVLQFPFRKNSTKLQNTEILMPMFEFFLVKMHSVEF